MDICACPCVQDVLILDDKILLFIISPLLFPQHNQEDGLGHRHHIMQCPASSFYLCILATLFLLVVGCIEAFSFLPPSSSSESARVVTTGPLTAATAVASFKAAPRFPSLIVRQAASAAGEVDVRLWLGWGK